MPLKNFLVVYFSSSYKGSISILLQATAIKIHCLNFNVNSTRITNPGDNELVVSLPDLDTTYQHVVTNGRLTCLHSRFGNKL